MSQSTAETPNRPPVGCSKVPVPRSASYPEERKSKKAKPSIEDTTRYLQEKLKYEKQYDKELDMHCFDKRKIRHQKKKWLFSILSTKQIVQDITNEDSVRDGNWE